MSEEKIILLQKLEGIADYVSRFLNQYKTQLLMKGYRLKKEGDIVLKTGIISKIDMGGWLKVEKKIPSKTRIKVQCRKEDEDIIFTVSSAKQKKEIPPELLVELESLIEKTRQKLQI